MKVYKFKCDCCGAKKYTKIEDGYQCEYCGAVQEVIISPKAEKQTVNDMIDDNYYDSSRVDKIEKKRFIRSKLIMCILMGGLGIHKFMEKNYILGVLYLLTGGIFGIGIIIDILVYIRKLMQLKIDEMDEFGNGEC